MDDEGVAIPMKKPWSWKNNIDLSEDVAEKLRQDFEVSLFRKALDHDPENVDILIYLGDAFTKRGMFQYGLEIDKRLVRVCPKEPKFYYNLACSHALLGEIDSAIQALEKAINLGYQDFEHMKKDSDLDNLRSDHRFTEILKNVAKSV